MAILGVPGHWSVSSHWSAMYELSCLEKSANLSIST